MSFENPQNNIENQEPTFEIMKTPDIVVQEEKGTQLFSLLLKAENPNWGETETPLAQETTEYFRKNPLDPKILETIREFHTQEVDEETLYNMALTYQHPERLEGVAKIVAKYKPHVKNSQEVHQKILTILESINQTFSSSLLADKFAEERKNDINKRLEQLKKNRKRIENIIEFFKPDSKTTNVQKINFVPTDPLYRQNSGRAFSAFPGEHIIMSHIDNVNNQDHEFCHSIVNPIVEKLSQQLTNKQKDKISQLANLKLKQDYGEDYFSLLCEEFVRTFNDVVKELGKIETYQDFKQKLSKATPEQFQQGLSASSSFRQRCKKLEITTINDLREKSQEYFEKFEKNQLRNLLFDFYQEYKNRPNKESENFEQFVLKTFTNKV